MNPGDEYRPFKLFHGSVVPFSLQARRDLHPGAKLLFGELAAVKGKSGSCHPSVEHLAERLGASVDQITRWLRDLTKIGLIKSRRRGPGSNAERVFIWHPMLESSLRSASAEPAKIPVQEQTEPAKTRVLNPQKSGSEPAKIRVAYKEEEVLLRGSIEEGKSSSAVEADEQQQDADEPPDDEPPSIENEDRTPALTESPDAGRATETAVAECLQAAVRSWGIPTPKGKLPAAEITALLEKIGATVEELAYFLRDTFRGERGGNPATWKYVLTSVQHWAADPKTLAGLEQKRMFTRLAHQQREREQRDREEREERELTLTTPAAPDAAIAIAAAELERTAHGRNDSDGRYIFGHGTVKVPEVLQKRYRRLGAEVTPAEVVKAAREHRRCDWCHGSGLTGSALNRSRLFCSCEYGIELEYEDPQRAAREIEQAHATLKSKLLVAAMERGMTYLGDAIEASEITEADAEIVFQAPTLYRMYFIGPDLGTVLNAAGESRPARFAWQVGAVRTLPPIPHPITAADFEPHLTKKPADGDGNGPVCNR